jgi:hypothetical protein
MRRPLVDGFSDLAPIAKKLWDLYSEWRDELGPRLGPLNLSRKQSKPRGRNLAKFAAGLGIGVGLGLLFAPARGRQRAGSQAGGPGADTGDAPRSLDVVTRVQRPSIQLRPTAGASAISE